MKTKKRRVRHRWGRKHPPKYESEYGTAAMRMRMEWQNANMNGFNITMVNKFPA